MAAGESSVLVIGAGAVAVSLSLAVVLTPYELSPAARMSPHARVIVMGALAMGALAFCFKLVALAILQQMSFHSAARAATPIAAPLQAPASPVPAAAPVWSGLASRSFAPEDSRAPARIALGRRLFMETALSRDGSLSCVSCHDIDGGAGADVRALSLGVGGQAGARNAPSVYNAALQKRLFWDGRARTLEEQALGPMLNPVEMAMESAVHIEDALRGNPVYPGLFAAAFGDRAITAARAASAVADFERSLVATDTPYDRFVAGDASALDESQKRGMALFQETGCTKCHAPPTFSPASLPGDGGLRAFPVFNADRIDQRLLQDKGAAAAVAARGVFRVPSLRNVALTAPYFHNGAIATLAEAVRIMAVAQLDVHVDGDTRPQLAVQWSADTKLLHVARAGALGPGDIADIVGFLEALSSDALAQRLRAAGGRGREVAK